MAMHPMTTSSVDRARQFRTLAEEIRTAAEAMRDPDARRTMIFMADDYDSLADHAEEQAERLARKGGESTAQG